MTYSEKLENAKILYPFDRWLEAYDQGLDQYSDENCDRAKIILDNLIDKLISLEETASINDKLGLFREAVEHLNFLNDEIDGSLIETGEREDLCTLFNEIATAAGLNPTEYGGGEGIASEWCDW
ncbi:hypothetical protein [Ohtaekwangia sp.]|jgi:hypothetical protein|uniref:hypothetical protein n=1 Tax=Ohtaekwangia sp. TaxID=2066019 RepID=UPI002F926ABC